MLPELLEIKKTICGTFSLSELEARLKPAGISGGGISEGGFLAPEESFMEVVEQDYHTLKALGTNYGQMAELAAKVFKLIRTENLNPSVEFDRERFSLVNTVTPGYESCPWNCGRDEQGYFDEEHRDKFGFPTSGHSQIYVIEKGDKKYDLMKRWNEAAGRIMNTFSPNDDYDPPHEVVDKAVKKMEKDLGIEYGGIFRMFYLSHFLMVTELTPHLIATHHFFEGNASYRTDPGKLWEFVNSGRKNR